MFSHDIINDDDEDLSSLTQVPGPAVTWTTGPDAGPHGTGGREVQRVPDRFPVVGQDKPNAREVSPRSGTSINRRLPPTIFTNQVPPQ